MKVLILHRLISDKRGCYLYSRICQKVINSVYLGFTLYC